MASPSPVRVKIDRQGHMVLPQQLREGLVDLPGEVLLRRTADGLLLSRVSEPGSVRTAADGFPVLHLDRTFTNAEVLAAHQFHARARPHLGADSRVPAVVLAGTYAQLRRTSTQPAEVAAGLLRSWTCDEQRILPTSSAAVRAAFDRAVEIGLGGDVHDALVSQTCLDHDVALVTLDRRQHRVALSLGVRSTCLLAGQAGPAPGHSRRSRPSCTTLTASWPSRV